jgi:hypothetical protein
MLFFYGGRNSNIAPQRMVWPLWQGKGSIFIFCDYTDSRSISPISIFGIEAIDF